MSVPELRMVERVRMWTQLGIRFRDAAFDLPVTHPLKVHAWLPGAAQAPVRAVVGPGGVYSFHGLPGQVNDPDASGPPLEYVISVEDPAGLYLPLAFSVTLPLGYRGEFLSATTGSPPGAPGHAYLFAAPGRRVPPGAAAIRADLVDYDTGEPAAWAVLRATLDGREAVGIADGRGRVLLLAPQPDADGLGLGSPPGTGAGTPAAQEWPVTLRVDWQPAALRFPFAAGAALPASWQARPSLRSIFEQDPALVVVDEGDAPAEDWVADLGFGTELVLRSRDAAGAPTSNVWITAGASIP